MAKSIYLSIEFGSGRLYEYSKKEKEGFEEFEGKNGISFRRYLNKGLYGIFQGVSIRSSDFGDQLSIHMKDIDGNNVYTSVPLFDNNGSIGDYAADLIAYLQDLKVDYMYRIYPYAIDNEGQNGKVYTNRGISIKYSVDDLAEEEVRDDYEVVKLTQSRYTGSRDNRTLVEGDIPAKEWTEKLGKPVLNTDARDQYLYEILMENAEDARKSKKKSGNKTEEGSTSKGPAPAPAPASTPTEGGEIVYRQGDPVPGNEEKVEAPVPAPAPASTSAPAPEKTAEAPVKATKTEPQAEKGKLPF